MSFIRTFKGFPSPNHNHGDEESDDEQWPGPGEDASPDLEPEIDAQALARKVYALLKQELALERERLT